jgi:tetratricopeptide (TPR) repeat protein
MERDPATYVDPVNYSLGLVDHSEAYVGVFAFRYGYVPSGQELSITEMELRRAESLKIPIFIFIMSPNHPIHGADVEQDPSKLEKLNRLKAELQAHYKVAFFTSPLELGAQIYEALTRMKEEGHLGTFDTPRIHRESMGVVPVPPVPYFAHPYIQTHQFFGRRAELRLLDAWAASDQTTLIVEAIGGAGKSALLWHWVTQHIPSTQRDLAGIIWWSFYETDATVNQFILHALAYIRQQTVEQVATLERPDREDALLRGLRERPYLLVLDGLERILSAYHRMDAPHLSDGRLRRCTDPRHAAFLQQLVSCAPTHVLISTRLVPQDLEDQGGNLIPGIEVHHLEGLNPQDALDLMESFGVHGDVVAMQHFMGQFGYHSLLVSIIAGHIANFRAAPGDFDAWYRKESAKLRLSRLEMAQRRTHVLRFALEGLTQAQRLLLSQIAAFRYPVDYAALVAVNPRFTPSTDTIWGRILGLQKLPREPADLRLHKDLTVLEQRGLLQWDRIDNRYDLHPVVRGYAFDEMQEGARRSAYARIRDHFDGLPPEDLNEVKEIGDLRRTLEIYHALIGTGLLDQAYSLYESRLGPVLHFRLATNHVIIELLMPLFPRGLSEPPKLTSIDSQARCINDLANALSFVGSTKQAQDMYLASIQRSLGQKNYGSLSVVLGNYADELAIAGKLWASLQVTQLQLDLSEVVGDTQGIAVAHLHFLELFAVMYEWDKADAAYRAFQSNPPLYNTAYWISAAEIAHAQLLVRNNQDPSATLDHLWSTVITAGDQGSQFHVLAERARISTRVDHLDEAMQYLQDAYTLGQKLGAPLFEVLAQIGKVQAMQGSIEDARRTAAEAISDSSRYSESIANLVTAHAAIADFYLLANDIPEAKRYGLLTYREAWADGPPYSFAEELDTATRILSKLQEPRPILPSFRPENMKPVPYEREIRAVINTFARL